MLKKVIWHEQTPHTPHTDDGPINAVSIPSSMKRGVEDGKGGSPTVLRYVMCSIQTFHDATITYPILSFTTQPHPMNDENEPLSQNNLKKVYQNPRAAYQRNPLERGNGCCYWRGRYSYHGCFVVQYIGGTGGEVVRR